MVFGGHSCNGQMIPRFYRAVSAALFEECLGVRGEHIEPPKRSSERYAGWSHSSSDGAIH